jgi:hypothetical protein
MGWIELRICAWHDHDLVLTNVVNNDQGLTCRGADGLDR